LRALGIGILGGTELIRAVNKQREVLELPPLAELTSNTSLKDGMLAASGFNAPQRLVKAVAAADLAQIRGELARSAGVEVRERVSDALGLLEPLIANEGILQKVTIEGFLRTGLNLIEAANCPLCDTEWDPAELRTHIEEKLGKLGEVVKRRQD